MQISRIGVEVVADDGVADAGEVEAQLVAAAGVRHEAHAAAAVVEVREDLVVGELGFRFQSRFFVWGGSASR